MPLERREWGRECDPPFGAQTLRSPPKRGGGGRKGGSPFVSILDRRQIRILLETAEEEREGGSPFGPQAFGFPLKKGEEQRKDDSTFPLPTARSHSCKGGERGKVAHLLDRVGLRY